MNPGEVALIPWPKFKPSTSTLRPARTLAILPGPYPNLLTAGTSTKLHGIVQNWDELIQPGEPDFAASGLHQLSVVQLRRSIASKSGGTRDRSN
jgi:hypothetical protein